jgi:hypothetical protein
MFKMKYIAMLVISLGVISLIIGAVFVGIALQKNNYLTTALRQQKITLGLTQQQVAAGELVDNPQSLQIASDTLAEHLQSIAPTYGDLMASNATGRFDPSDPRDLTYGQGLNLQNAMNMAILSFGVVQATMATGGALIVIGIAVGAAGLVLFRLGKREFELIQASSMLAGNAAG